MVLQKRFPLVSGQVYSITLNLGSNIRQAGYTGKNW